MREFLLESFFARWQPFVRHQLTTSESETLSLTDLLDLADAEDRDRWDAVKFGYTDPGGAMWLRQTISDHYRPLLPNSVLCFAGAQEAIFAAMHALLKRGDHAIVVTPNYQSAETVPLAICDVTGIALDPDQDWELDIDEVKAAIRPNTKLVSINFPNNPTGKILSQERYAALIALCRTHGLWLFSDEVYRLIEQDPAKRLAPAVSAYEKGISLGGLSKSFGLPGLRMGWLACGDPTVMQTIRHVKTYLSICATAPSEILACIALKAAAKILARNRQIAETNLVLIRALFNDHDDLFDWREPDGGVVAFPRYLGADGVQNFCERLIHDHGVLLMPSTIFHSELTEIPRDHFRIGFGRQDFAAGLSALADSVTLSRTEKRRAVI
jgi:aspartate/methionine/tyrosine aminotransferase